MTLLGFDETKHEEAIDLDDEPQQERTTKIVHCPKCGFAYEVQE